MFGVDNPRIVASVRAYVKLMRTARTVTARSVPRLSAAGITTRQLGVLEALLHLGPLTQRSLIDKVLTSPGNMTDVIDKLEKRGYVTRSRVETDRRNVEVGLTPEGLAFISALFPLHADDLATAMKGLSDAEIATLDTLLRRLGRAAASCKMDAEE
jgi:MarR family 2-MHQ and catechol resistance regulon transcriptional repressor